MKLTRPTNGSWICIYLNRAGSGVNYYFVVFLYGFHNL